MTKDCNICCETYNKSTRIPITCYNCDETSCRTCITTYLLGGIDKVPNCLHCDNIWTHDFFVKVMTKNFINSEWKRHCENVLFELEKSKLPDTQNILENEYKIQTYNNQLIGLYVKINDIRNNINSLEINPTSSSSTFIKKCPVDDCRGYLSTQWKCGICQTRVCAKCGELKAEDHECIESNIKTMELLRKDTKNCPKCAIPIHFIDGCRQMWCTQCHVAFDWKTLKIEKGRVHNPHFYEWQRNNNNGVAPRVDDCEDINDNLDFLRITQSYTLIRIHRFRADLLQQLITLEEDNTDIRLKYLKQEITETEFKTKIQRRNKQFLLKCDIHEIAQTFCLASNDILKNSYNQSICEQMAENQLESLRLYINKCLVDVLDKFNSKRVTLYIHDNWYRLII